MRPRVYCDANLPAGLIRFMRERLRWDVFFVMEEDDLRRASDIEHFRMAAQLRRTLLTLDKDYLDDVLFPPAEGSGVLVMSAPHQAQFERLLTEIDRVLFRPSPDTRASVDASRMPLTGASCTCTPTGTGSARLETEIWNLSVQILDSRF